MAIPVRYGSEENPSQLRPPYSLISQPRQTEFLILDEPQHSSQGVQLQVQAAD